MVLTSTCKTAFALGMMLSVLGAAGARAQSATACDAYARSYANDASRQGQILRGGAKGGLVGLGIGAIAGGAGVGAAIGGGLGAIAGGAKRGETADRMYHAAYADCMAGRI